MWRAAHAARLPTEQQATVYRCQDHGSGKRGRSGTGLSSPVTGSQATERADSNVSADLDDQDGWTTVKVSYLRYVVSLLMLVFKHELIVELFMMDMVQINKLPQVKLHHLRMHHCSDGEEANNDF